MPIVQLSAGEGMQLAAAATLAGGGPGVLDKLRGSRSLDWFRLGSSPTSPTTGMLNQRAAASSSGTGGTALNAGKYMAPGVSVGVSQGISRQPTFGNGVGAEIKIDAQNPSRFKSAPVSCAEYTWRA